MHETWIWRYLKDITAVRPLPSLRNLFLYDLVFLFQHPNLKINWNHVSLNWVFLLIIKTHHCSFVIYIHRQLIRVERPHVVSCLQGRSCLEIKDRYRPICVKYKKKVFSVVYIEVRNKTSVLITSFSLALIVHFKERWLAGCNQYFLAFCESNF